MDSSLNDFVERELAASNAAVSALYKDAACRAAIGAAGAMLVETMRAGKKLLIAGNGGSASDAQHIAGEFVSRFHFDRPGLPAIALSTDTSILTAIGNDYGYDYVFARQIEALANEGDVFLGITTSGNSKNIVSALNAAKKKNVSVIGLTGRTGGKIREMCDLVIHAPADDTPRIQECHLVIYHLLCAYVEEALFADLNPKKR